MIRSPSRRARRSRLRIAVVASLAVSTLAFAALPSLAVGPAAGQEAAAALSDEVLAGWVGRPLAEALAELQATGLSLVFTSRLVRPEMVVERAPRGDDPRKILEQLLAPHGLRVAEPVAGTLVIVAADEDEGRRGWTLRGQVRSSETLEPVAGASVRVLETDLEVATLADGRFATGALAPGLYTVEIEASGFIPERLQGVVIDGAVRRPLNVPLRPLPFVEAEIVVRPSRLSLFGEAPAAPFSLSRGDIESLPHLGGDVFRSLSLLPGVAANDRTAQFSVHGGRRDEVQILLDGQELYEAYHLKDFDSALSFVVADGLSSVSLTTGAFPADRGDRMSGVLDMTTREASGPRRTQLSLSLLAATAATTGGFGDGRGGYLISARRGSIDLASRVIGQEDPSFWDLFGKGELVLTERQRLRANLLHASDTLDFFEAPEGEVKQFTTDYDSSYLWLTHQATAGERTLVETRGSWSSIVRDRFGAEDEEEQSFEVLDRRDFEIFALAQSWSVQVAPDHTLRFGVEGRSFEAEYDYFNRSELTLMLSTPLTEARTGLTRFAGAFDGEHLSGWITDRFRAAEPLTLELGLRYDRHTLTDDTLWSPRASAAWRLAPSSVVRASWGHFYQSHRPYELGVEDGETTFLAAERSEHWVLGYERQLGGERASLSALRVELFRRDVDDPRPRYENLFEAVNTFPEIEPDRVRIRPQASEAEGVELLLRGAAGARAEWWINYAYATVEDRFAAGEEARRSIDQPHALNAYLGYRFDRGWQVALAWRFHTGWPTTPVFLAETEEPEGGEEGAPEQDGDEGPERVPVLGPLNSERLTDYHRLDLRASRKWTLRSGELTFFVDVQNVYDRRNLAGFDLAIDDESGELEIQAEGWTGIFPSLGIRWEF